jgi:alginate O-acetyltransferase complex protein AlgJ
MQSTLEAARPMPARAGGPTDPSHDEQLRRGLIKTEISRSTAWVLVLTFLLVIFAVPLAQAYLERREDEESPLLELFRRAPTAENLRQVEKDVEEASYPKAFVQPRLQLLLTELGRVGNKLAIVGQKGWLYYKPGVLHVGGPGFLDHNLHAVREKEALDAGEPPIAADPRPAILGFHRALSRRGIRLVLLPVPDKAALTAQHLHGRVVGERWPRNPDYDALLEQLRQQGVAVVDVRESLGAPPKELFLIQDTHWTPAFMQRVAQNLARYLEQVVELPSVGTPPFKAVPQSVSRVGDLVDMLKLPDDQALFSPQSVTVEQVQDGSGAPWEPDAKADVLLLGDSFTNIFTLEGMGWGVSAGLGPQLALALRRPLDVIAQNDSGAFATRQALARELAAGSDRLAGKRVVVWQFASRELSVGDWKLMDYTLSTTPEAP